MLVPVFFPTRELRSDLAPGAAIRVHGQVRCVSSYFDIYAYSVIVTNQPITQ